MDLKNRVQQIVTDLEDVRENMLALSDDIWLNIDHNNTDAMQEGVQFKQKYNQQMPAFQRLASEISDLLEGQFTTVQIYTLESVEGHVAEGATREHSTHELDTEKAYTLQENFHYKRPYGFVILGNAYKNVLTWQKVYLKTCLFLLNRNPELFWQLPNYPDFISRRGNKDFSTIPGELRQSLELVQGLYAEANLSANSIRDRIRRLLATFEISETDFVWYLREDRSGNMA